MVHGDVQGVGFRYFVQRRARSAGLRGWVRNRDDGSVELEAEGDREALEQLLTDVSRGPGMAEVDRVEPEWGDGGGDYEGFDIKPTR